MTEDYHRKRTELINYLNSYLLKKFRMNRVFEGIIDRLKGNYLITQRQFHSIIKFLERERKFKRFNRNEIEDYFSPIISSKFSNRKEVTYEPNTICQFLH